MTRTPAEIDKRVADMVESMRHPPRFETCQECGGEGGSRVDETSPRRVRRDSRYGETYYTNWNECDRCHGTGEVRKEEEET